jgi:O-antigen ligase
VRYWPALLVLPVAIHFVAPGALGGLYKSFFPEEGLIGSVQGREGEGGSGRFSDIGPGLRLWTEEPVVGRGVGSETIFEPAVVRVGGAPPVPVIFDNQYMSTLVELGLLGFLVVVWLVWGTVFRLIRGARRSTGPPSDLLTACAVATAGFGTAMFFFDAFAFVQCTLVFVFVAVLGLRVAQLQRRRVPKLVERPVPAA